MRKVTAVFMICAVLIFSVFPAFAWEADDIINDGGEEIIVPLQKPAITTGAVFALDSETPDHVGITGGVYKGKVDVSRSQATTVMAVLNNYAFNAGTYKLSLWFMEDKNNADKMTRMIRPMIDSTTISNMSVPNDRESGRYLFFSGNQAGITLGVWKHATLEFVVSSTENSVCLGKPTLSIKWECPSTTDCYNSKNITGDFYVYFSDISLIKYPAAPLSLVNTNSGATLSAQESAFEAEFSAPPDLVSLKNITINGAAQNADTLDVRTEENKLIISPYGGFPPGKTYNVNAYGICDIFGRAYEGAVMGTITARDYLSVDYKGLSGNNAFFDITNNMSGNADFVIVVFYYSGSNVKHTFYSQELTGVAPESFISVSVPVSGELTGLSAKAQVWDISARVPMPLSAEIEL